MSTQTAIATRGIPGSGKSTWANAWVAAAEDRARINRDDIRMSMFGKTWLPASEEQLVDSIELALLGQLLDAGKSVVIDATGLNQARTDRYRAVAFLRGVTLDHQDFPVDLGVALERNAARDRQVPEDVVRGMYAGVADGFAAFV